MSGAQTSPFAAFILGLVNDGQARVVSPCDLKADESVIAAIKTLDEHARGELGLAAPELSLTTAAWAGALWYRACEFTVCRDIPEGTIHAAFAAACPEPGNPQTIWSADLFFRHLPALLRLARQLSSGDPLVQALKGIAHAWPLSSAELNDEGKVDLTGFIDHPALRRLYLDRITASANLSRLSDPRIREWLAADLGLHQDLSPALATALTHGTIPS